MDAALLESLIPQECHLRIHEVNLATEGVRITLESTAVAASCPHCQHESWHLHGRYMRRLKDRPCLGQQLHLALGKPGTVATLLAEDRAAMLPIPAKRFEARRVAEVSADSLSLVRFDTNSYSVPTKYAHRTLTVVGTVDEVRIVFEDRLIARHERCWDREQFRFDPIHYLALLERKPGGFDFARPLNQWVLPECFGVLRRRLEADGSDGFGTRGFIRVLRLLEVYSLPQLSDAVDWALTIDVIDPDGIRSILDYRADRPVPVFSLDGRPHLASVRLPVTDVTAYGVLLAGEGSR